ncbi:MAG: DUF1553 domain-containing protein [Planctomycetes bacterium]|nr:DUF1553 domain-containing protein [Planctomycetota bacterium]
MARHGRGSITFALAALGALTWSARAAAAPPDAADLAARIDKNLAARWAAEKVAPAAMTDDTAFVRRVHLDLVGRIPTVAEVRAFVGDRAADKRAALVARLVDSGAHFRHAAAFWRREWLPQTDTPQFAGLADEFEGWMAVQLRDGVRYDRIVRELMTAKRAKTGPGTPLTFLSAGEFKPENLAANTTRAFLGVNLDCAQCHDHPFARWTRDQFWETAAFFARPAAADGAKPVRLELAIPNTKRAVAPRLLTDPQPRWPEALADDTGRTLLANWVTAKDNPYFAKNAVNRVWAGFFGTGLVEPLDDLSGEGAANHPELLSELAKAFADSGFDLKYLTTAITLTRAYQHSSEVHAGGATDPRLFARAAIRGLTGEQLYDSLRVAAGMPAERDDLGAPGAARDRKRFADRFRVERPGTAQRSILQALALMNGTATADLTTVGTAPALRAVAEAPFLTTAGKVEALYLAALGRKPTAEESTPLVKYVEKGGADGDPAKALADVFWALLNSVEFNTNH